MEKLRILHITPDFNYACGRSYYVYLLLKYFKLNKHYVMLLTNGGDSFGRLEDNGIKYIIENKLHSKNPFAIRNNVTIIRNIIEENKIDIIHTHHRHSEQLCLYAIKSLKNNKPKSVITVLSFVKRRYGIEYKSDGIISVSKSVTEYLQNKFKIPKLKIHEISNFVDDEELNESAECFYGEDVVYILSIGRFHPDKDYPTLIKAVSLLKNYNIILILIGDGELRNDYLKLAHKLKVTLRIEPPRMNLKSYYLGTDICVLPSVREPFPNFMLQSGLHMRPFIGSNVDGIKDLIRNYENGILFEKGNENDLAKKIEYIIQNKDICKKLYSNLYLDVINNYTPNIIIPKIKEFYSKLLNG